MERRPKVKIRAVPIFAKLDNVQLHRITASVVDTKFRAGNTIVQQGEMGDSMYIIDRGRCDVLVNNVVVHTMSDGDSFGELSMLSDEARSASIVAASEEVTCMMLSAALTRPFLEQCWGKGELDKREQTLRRVPMFSSLARGELRRLATQLERVQFPDTNVAIIAEGEVGKDMFVISKGNCEAFTVEHGRVKEYGPGDFFGELGVVGGSTALRKATVRTVPSKVGDRTTVDCLRLAQNDVERIMARDSSSVRDAINNSLEAYRKAESLKVSEVVAAPLRKFWDLMVIESALLSRISGGTEGGTEGQVTREGYEQMHLRVSKSLAVGFNLQAAKNSANQDWAEDITAFSGDAGVSIWLEEVKKKFKAAATKEVTEESGGWEALFKAYDEDGSGEMEFEEFEAAVRGDCNIGEAVVSQGELRDLFGAVDQDSSGDIDLHEFVEFLESDPLAADMTFKVFSEAMQQLAQLWVGKADEIQYKIFLDAIYNNITERDGRLRGVVIEGDSYRLAPLDLIESMVNPEDRKVHIDGVDINDIHSITGQTPAELAEARRQADEEAAKRAAEAARKQAELDAAALARRRVLGAVGRRGALAGPAAGTQETNGTQEGLTDAEMAEIREKQRLQRELRNKQAKRRNGVLRSNADTARDDFKKKKKHAEISLLINGREKLAPDGTLLRKGEVDPHILDMEELCLFTRQPLRRSERRLYSDPELGVTLPWSMSSISGDAATTALEGTGLQPTASPTDASHNMSIGPRATDKDGTKVPILSLHNDVREHEPSPRLPRLSSLSHDSCATHLTRHESRISPRLRSRSYIDTVNSPRLRERQASYDSDTSAVVRSRLRSSAATGVGNGSATYRAMVQGMREVAHVSKLMQRHPADAKKRQRKRAEGSAPRYVSPSQHAAGPGAVGWKTERGTVGSVRSSARATVAASKAHSAREPSEGQRPRGIEASRMMHRALGGPPKRFM
jgi:CRP-like cAMP-binding protein/Ca2+-binding EF-hand superfamily protein